jgi:K+-sensing histidine kinase KdpD
MNPEKRKLLRTFRTEEPESLIKDLSNMISSKHERIDDLYLEANAEHVSIEMGSENFYKLFTELLDNAFRFSIAGKKVNVRLSIDDCSFLMEIEDEGRGMSREQIKNIAALTQFERTIYEQQGVGLGLVIAKKLVEIHDGKFDILSEEGKGTLIKCSLPLAKQKYY